MLNDAAVSQFKKVYLAPGYTDLRRGIDGLASIVRFQFELDPYDKNTLFLFCGRKNSRTNRPACLFRSRVKTDPRAAVKPAAEVQLRD